MTRCDVLVIGAGSAGCVLANRLSRRGDVFVTLLEAGGRVTDPDMRNPARWPLNYGRDYDWSYWTTPQPGLDGRRLDWPRGRGLGGSSLLNAMAHMRGCRHDYAAWTAETGDERWSWEGLLPYFLRMEDHQQAEHGLRGSGGPLPVFVPGPDLSSPLVEAYLEAWQSLGVPRIADHNGGEMVGATPNSLTIRDGARATVADGYLDPVLGRDNLHVITHAVVHRLELRGHRIVSAHFEHQGSMRSIEADQVVLAGGAVADPLLLMRSGIGDPDVLLGAGVRPVVENRGVGLNLHDHLLGAGNVYQSRLPVPSSRLQLSESMTYLRSTELAAASGRPDVVVGCVLAPSASQDLAPALSHVGIGDAYTLLFGVTSPTSRGSIRITGPDLGDAPVIDPRYLETDHDRDAFATALDLAREVGRTPQMAQWREKELLPGTDVVTRAEIDAFIRRAAITHHHPVGTLSMGATETAPVTPDLRLRGLENCFVADASVIPSIPSGPVHAAVLAIAESFAENFSHS